MVLDHVAHRTRAVVIFAAPVHAHGFGHGYLDVIDVLGVPKRLEQDVAKTDRHQVLDGFLAQIMIDAINLAFVEMFGQRGVQREGAFQVAPERFFHDNA